MKTRFTESRFCAVLIFVFAAFTQAERGACYARHLELPGSSALMQYVVIFCLMAYWLDRNSHERQMGQVWDMGFFLLIAWPVIIPYHPIKTRGIKRASIIFLFLAMTCFGAFATAAALSRAR